MQPEIFKRKIEKNLPETQDQIKIISHVCSPSCPLLNQYSKTCLKRPLQNRQNKGLKEKL